MSKEKKKEKETKKAYDNYCIKLSQKEVISFKEEDYVTTSGKDRIFKNEHNKVTRYYVRLTDLLINRFGFSKKTHAESSRFINKTFFPNMIYAKIDESLKEKFSIPESIKLKASFYIEISKEAFDRSGYEKYLTEDLVNELFKEINNSIFKEINNSNINNAKVNKEDETNNMISINTVSNDNNIETKECIITTGGIPLNYNELIESLNLKENYGSKFSSEIESSIKQIFSLAKYSVNVPVVTKYIEKPIPKEYEIYKDIYDVSKNNINRAEELLKNTSLIESNNNVLVPKQELIEQENQNINQNVSLCNIDIPYENLGTFISKMQEGSWKNPSQINKYTNSMYIIACNKLFIEYKEFAKTYQGDKKDPSWYLFRDNNLLFVIADFYISDIKGQYYCKNQVQNTKEYFLDLISVNYDNILNHNIKEFLLKPLGYTVDNDSINRMKEYIKQKAEEEIENFKSIRNQSLYNQKFFSEPIDDFNFPVQQCCF